MGIQKVALKFLVESCGKLTKSSALLTKVPKASSLKGLKYAPKSLTTDVINISDKAKPLHLLDKESFVELLMNEKKLWNGQTRFYSDDANLLYDLMQEYNPEFVEKLINAKTIIASERVANTFDADRIKLLCKSSENNEYLSLINKLFDITKKGADGKEYLFLTGRGFEDIIKAYPNNKKAINLLLENKSHQHLLYSIDSENAKYFIDKNFNEIVAKEVSKNNWFEVKKTTSGEFQIKIKDDEHKVRKIINFEMVEDSNTASNLKPSYLSIDRIKDSGEKITSIKELPHGKIEQETIPVKRGDYINYYELKTRVYDEKGHKKYIEVIKPSKNIENEYIITGYHISPEGKVIKEDLVKTTRYGQHNEFTKSEKKFKSPSGYQTEHTISTSSDSREMTYIIKDKNGDIVTKVERTYKKVDENHYITTLNERKYDLQFGDDNLVVKEFDNNGNLLRECCLDNYQLDFSLKNLYKKIPGDYFFYIKDGKSRIRYKSIGGSEYDIPTNEIWINREEEFTAAHELGHMLDHKIFNDLYKDTQFRKIFTKELSKYRQINTTTGEKPIAYFTQVPELKMSADDETRFYNETIAEMVALLSGYPSANGLGIRSVLLQKDFPETLSYIAKILDPSTTKTIPTFSNLNFGEILGRYTPNTQIINLDDFIEFV